MNCGEFKPKKRSLFKIISEDDAWEDVPDYFKDINTQPNKRFSVVFRDNFDNLTAPFKVPLEPKYVYLDKEGNVITEDEAKDGVETRTRGKWK